MKTKFAIIVVACMLLASCSTPRFVPAPENAHLNTKGCFIKLFDNTNKIYKGEFIAMDSGQILILDENQNLFAVDSGFVSRYSVQFAKPKQYGWAIPLFTMASLFYGWYITPAGVVNILGSGLITFTAKNDFKYNSYHLDYQELQNYARFPQGLPANIQRDEIH